MQVLAGAEATGDVVTVVDVLRTHATTPVVAERSCAVLAALCSASRGARVAASEAGALAAVLSAMTSMPLTPAVQQRGCAAFVAMYADDTPPDVLQDGREAAMRIALAAMRVHPRDDGVQAACCAALAALCDDPSDPQNQNCRAAQRLDAMRFVVAAMAMHMQVADVVRHAAAAIRAMSFDAGHKRRVAACGALDMLVAALAEHRLSLGVVQQCCETLRMVCTNDSGNARAAVAAGMLPGMQSVMRAHTAVVEPCFGTIEELCSVARCDEDDSPVAVPEALCDAANQAVVAAMRAHPLNSAVQSAGIALLHKLMWNGAIARNSMCKAGALKAILGAIRVGGIDESMRSDGAGVLVKLCSGHVAAKQAGPRVHVEALVAALKHPGPNVGSPAQICEMITELCLTSDGYSAAACAASAPEAVVAALRASRDDANVQETGCGALASMWTKDNDELAAIVGAAGAIEEALLAMEKHAANERVAWAGCEVLGSVNAANHARARAAGGVEAVVRAMRTHTSCEGVQATGCTALKRMCGATAETREYAITAGALAAARVAAASFADQGSDEAAWVAEEAKAAVEVLTGQERKRARED